MRNVVRSPFLWQFAGGFVLGAIGLMALQPASATQRMTQHVEHAARVIG